MDILFKESLNKLKPYAAGKPIEEVKRELGISKVVKLASNENPYGCSELAKRAIIEAAEHTNIYPDGGAYDLKNALTERFGAKRGEIIFGTGSDGLIELIAKTFLGKGDESIMPTPSFSLYESNTLAMEAKPVKIPLDKDYKMDLSAMLGAINDKTKVLWLCNPNNPTGQISSGDEIFEFLEKVPDHILVVSDEAYYEFASGRGGYPETLKNRRKNLIVLRTFSKIYGLAGLRCGYGIADEAVISEMEKVRSPFNVSSVAQAAAVASLSDDGFLHKTLSENEKNLNYLCAEFDKMGLYYIPSFTNFVAVRVPMDSKEAYDRLLAKGYIVKGGHVLGMENGFLRVTVGTKEECEGFLDALQEVILENEKTQ